jgi:hypothetical protein
MGMAITSSARAPGTGTGTGPGEGEGQDNAPADPKEAFRALVFTGWPFSNGALEQNQALALSTFRWLTDRTHLVTVPTKRYVARRLDLTTLQVVNMQWLLIGWLPGGIAVLGLIVFWLRRRP